MTRRQFDEAIRAVIGGDLGSDASRRVFVASCFVMRSRLGLPDDVSWCGPTQSELAGFLGGIDDRQRKVLRQVAKEITCEGVPIHAGSTARQ